MTSLFALTYPYLSGYQHIGASITSSVDIGGYASQAARGAGTLGSWNQFGTLVNQPGSQGAYDKSPLLTYGQSNLSSASLGASNNQVTPTLARDGILPFKTRKYTAKGSRSCPYNVNTLVNEDVSAIVRRRNERERERVRCVNKHYEHLKHHLPMKNSGPDKRISKLEILKSAINYISELQNVLEQCNNNNTGVDEQPDAPKTTRAHSFTKTSGLEKPAPLLTGAAKSLDTSLCAVSKQDDDGVKPEPIP